MDILLRGLAGVAGVACVVCFIVVIITMFKRGSKTLAIVCLVLSPCFLIGPVIAYLVGWMHATDWNLRNVMLIWTICFLISALGGGAGFAAR
ncbi:MAG TPA: hypothetical protein VFE62_08785 [Gemmataceae bacterium]|nr:hypothetical protein [Gemmataceae bacterium]